MKRGMSAGKQRLPALVISLGFVSLFTDVATEMIVPVMPLFLTVTLGASATAFGLIEGVADLIASVIKGLSGAWSDRGGGRRRWILAGYSLSTVARPFIALATAPWHVLALRGTDRVGKGLRTAPRDALIAMTVSREQHGRAFGFHRAMDHGGALLGGLLAAGLLALGLGPRSIIAWSIVPGVLAVLCIMIFVKEPAPSRGAGHHAQRAPVPWRHLPSALGPELRRYLCITACFAVGNSSDAFLLLKAREAGLPDAALPLLWAWIHVARVISNLVGGSLSDRLGARRTVATGWLCYAVVYALVALCSQPWQIWVVLGAYGLYNGLTEGGEKSLVAELAEEETKGAAFGAFHLVTGVIALPASALTGILWDRHGSLVALFVSAAFALVASIWLLIAPPARISPSTNNF